MADPILVDHFRAQVAMAGLSGLPEDVYINNFVFRNNDVALMPGNIADNIKDALTEFYTAAATVGTTSVALTRYLTPHRSQTVNINIYNLGEPPPRQPTKRSFTAPLSPVGSVGMPEEVAACLSYYAGRPLPRFRGRIYLGPLHPDAAQIVTGKVRLNTNFQQLLGVLAARLMGKQLVTWVLLSPTRAAVTPITGGWADDAFDTQRRRGLAPTGRTLWGAAPVSA